MGQGVHGLRREQRAVAEDHCRLDAPLPNRLKRLRRAQPGVTRRAPHVEGALARGAGPQREEAAGGLPKVARREGEVDERVRYRGALGLRHVVERVHDGGAARLREGPRRRGNLVGDNARCVRHGVEV